MAIGIFLILASFLPWILKLHYTLPSAILFAVSWGIGYLIVCNSLIHRYSKKQDRKKLRITHIRTLIVGAISALIVEGLGNWAWKLWYYPHFSIAFYLVAILAIQVIYFYFILKGYLAARAFLLSKGLGKVKLQNKKKYEWVFILFGLLGTLGLIFSLVNIGREISKHGLSFFNSYGFQSYNLLGIVIISLSVVFVLEYLEHKERDDSLFSHLVNGDWTPLTAILIASTLTAITMEGFNIPLSIWLYTNWPLAQYNFHGLPLTVFIAWPFQYIWLISLYRVLYRKQTTAIWY